MKKLKLLFLSLLFFVCWMFAKTGDTFAQNHSNGIDFIGPDGVTYPDFTYAGLPDGIPDVATVTTLQPSGGDDKSAIENAIDNLPAEGGAILLKNGTWHISDNIEIKRSDVVIRGESRDGTVLEVTGGGGGRGLFHFQGKDNKTRRFLSMGFARGDMTIDLGGSSGFEPEVGQYVFVGIRGLPPNRKYRFKSSATADEHPETYNGIYKSEWVMDMVKVVSREGDIIAISTPMKEDFNPDWGQTAFIRDIDVVTGCGVENLTIDNTGRNSPDGITFGASAECWVKEVTILMAGSKPVYWSQTRGGKNILVTDCLFDGVCNTGGGGNGYGGFEYAYDCMFRRCEFRDMRHAPNIQSWAAGGVFLNCTFLNSNAEMHSKFGRHCLIDNCTVLPGNNWTAEVGWKTKHLDNISNYHDPSGGRLVLFNSFIDLENKGGAVYLGGLDYHSVIAYNKILCGGTESNDVIGSYTVQIGDFCDETWFIGNVFANKRLGDKYYYKESTNSPFPGEERTGPLQWAGVMFLPGYKSGGGTAAAGTYGQTGVAWGEEPVIPYTRQYAQLWNTDNDGYAYPMAPIMQGTGVTPEEPQHIHFADNKFYGTAPDEAYKGYNTPATDRDNLFQLEHPDTIPDTEPFAESLYEWQMAMKSNQTVPNAPSDLSATGVSSSRIDLTWTDNSSDENRFKIERSLNGSGWSQVATVSADTTTYSFTGLEASTTYYFRVRAYNWGGYSDYSNEDSATTADGTGDPYDTTDDMLGEITAQGEHSGSGHTTDKAFDNDINTKWLDFAEDYPDTRSSWIQYKYANNDKYIVSSYTITSANDAPERDPKDWELLGSNDDGVTWTTLDTKVGETLGNRHVKNTYDISNSTAYNIYRLKINCVYETSTATSVQLAEIEFIGLPDSTGSQNPTHALALDEVETLTVYPNPASSQVTIQLNDMVYNVRVYDINGNIVKVLRNVNGVKTLQTNEIGDPGVYFIEVIFENEILTEKLFLK